MTTRDILDILTDIDPSLSITIQYYLYRESSFNKLNNLCQCIKYIQAYIFSHCTHTFPLPKVSLPPCKLHTISHPDTSHNETLALAQLLHYCNTYTIVCFLHAIVLTHQIRINNITLQPPQHQSLITFYSSHSSPHIILIGE